jgi:threonine aldolase
VLVRITGPYGPLFDTISLCLSKGLGAPVGSLLLSSHHNIQKGKKYRKILGGGMRQSGYLAAAGLYALQNNIERLQEDHEKATLIEKILRTLPYVSTINPVESNIIIFNLKESYSPPQFVKKLAEHEIYAFPLEKFVRLSSFNLSLRPSLLRRGSTNTTITRRSK